MTSTPRYSDYEYQVAMALASSPGIVCFDDLNYFSLSLDDGSTSLWETPTTGTELDEADDYDESTARVDVFQVVLCDPREQALRGRPFKFLPAVRVISRRLQGIMPSADIIMVDAFPLTREIVRDAMRVHLRRTEYAKEENTFLWGPEIEVIDPDR